MRLDSSWYLDFDLIDRNTQGEQLQLEFDDHWP